MDYEEMKVHRLEHQVDGWGAKKTDEFLLKADVDEWADEQMLAYNDLEKRLSKTIAEKGRKNAELFAENASLRKRIKELEKACFYFDLSYHAMEKELKKADEKIKKLEEQLKENK